MKRFAIFGASGCGRGVLPLARQQLLQTETQPWDLVFVDDNPPAARLNGQRVLTYAQWLTEPAASRHISLAIANGGLREKLAARCQADGVVFFDVRAANVVLMDEVQVGPGAVLCPFVTLTSNIRIGQHFQANLYSYVEHDCVIGDFVTFAPGVQCNGNVVIEDHAYIGAGAIDQAGATGQTAGHWSWCRAGMGAVVTTNVATGTTVVGNPARLLVTGLIICTGNSMLNTPFSPWPSLQNRRSRCRAHVLLSNKVNYWTGTECREFEKEFAQWCGHRHALALANGTLALDVALKALGIGPGDEVVVTPRTFIASVSCVVNVGAIPGFCRCRYRQRQYQRSDDRASSDPEDQGGDLRASGGWPCDMDPIMALAGNTA